MWSDYIRMIYFKTSDTTRSERGHRPFKQSQQTNNASQKQPWFLPGTHSCETPSWDVINKTTSRIMKNEPVQPGQPARPRRSCWVRSSYVQARPGWWSVFSPSRNTLVLLLQFFLCPALLDLYPRPRKDTCQEIRPCDLRTVKRCTSNPKSYNSTRAWTWNTRRWIIVLLNERRSFGPDTTVRIYTDLT